VVFAAARHTRALENLRGISLFLSRTCALTVGSPVSKTLSAACFVGAKELSAFVAEASRSLCNLADALGPL